MGYANVAGDLNVLSTTLTQNLTVRGDTTLSGNLTAPAGFHNFGNVTVGNLLVTGNFTITATNTQVTNALSINNAGTTTALKVVQYEGGGPGHIQNVAEFWDFTTLAMVIDPEGNVAIHTTSSPGYALTVAGGALVDTLTSQLYFGNAFGLSNLNSANLTGALTSLQLSNTQSNITSLGTLVNLTVSGVLAGGLFTGNASGLSNINSSNLVGNVAAANVASSVTNPAQVNITSVGTLSGLTVSGLLVASNGSGISNLNS